MKKNYSFLSAIAAVAMALCVSFGFQSCGQVDNPLEEIVNTISENTGYSPEEITAMLESAMSEAAVQEAIAYDEPITIKISNGETSSGDKTITVPMVDPVNGKKLTVKLVFTGTYETSETNPLVFKADEGSGAESGDSENNLVVNMPTTTGLVISIELPNTTVTLTSSGNTVYKSVTAKTAIETMFIESGVTVQELNIKGGTVVVKNGGKVETYVYPAGKAGYIVDNGDHNLIREIHIVNRDNDYGVEPLGVRCGDYYKYELRGDGDEELEDENIPYLTKKLKIIKGEAEYANLFFWNEKPLEKLTIAEGAKVLINDQAAHAQTIEGEGNGSAVISSAMVFGQNTDEVEGDDCVANDMPFSEVQTLKNLTIDPYYDRNGLPLGFSHMISDAEETTNCNINFSHVTLHEFTGKEAVLEKCKFNSDLEEKRIDIEVPYQSASRSSFTITFDGCNFADGYKFYSSFVNEQPTFDENGEQVFETIYMYWGDGPDPLSTNNYDALPDECKNAGEVNLWSQWDNENGVPVHIPGYQTAYGPVMTQTTYDNFTFTIILKNCKYGGNTLTNESNFIGFLNLNNGVTIKVIIDGVKYEWHGELGPEGAQS